MKSNISEQTNYLQSKFTIIHPQNYKMSPLRGVTLAGLAKKYPKNGGERKANYIENNTWVRGNTRFISSVEHDISRVSAANE